jgi:YHS domain-containing protein
MGGKIDEDIHLDHEGRRVYFCCEACTEEFKEDPQKYIARLDAQLLEQALRCLPQQTCPVMGGKINEDIHTEHEGRRVYFCCEACTGKFKEDPEKYLQKLDARLRERLLLRVPQEECPVMGGKVNRNLQLQHEGRRVYFCCGGCPQKFQANPERYLRKLDEQAEQNLLRSLRQGECPRKLGPEQAPKP